MCHTTPSVEDTVCYVCCVLLPQGKTTLILRFLEKYVYGSIISIILFFLILPQLFHFNFPQG